MPFADVNGQTLYYTDSGGDGTPVILSGAMLLDTVILEPLTDALATAGYRAIAFDARYHGQTKSDGQEFDFIDWARDFLGLADVLGIEQAIFGGESGGAMVSLHVPLLAPERVIGMLLIGVSAAASDRAETQAITASMNIWTKNGPTREGYGDIANFAAGSPAAGEALLARWQKTSWRDMDKPTRAMLGRPDIVSRLGEITCPAVIVHGLREFFVPIDKGEEVAENWGGPKVFEWVDNPKDHLLSVVHDPNIIAAVMRLMSQTFPV
ncbi:hypothetical protein BKG82_27825 [Mycobacteroides chelonae]|uniref:AB hydrolase-1 domain-containing protein n=1 Tax=Mycobacteroides chelonae TaxID=1774 RepID=A0A1S1LDD6_MYCCH|nr:alpha/beta hydrolase [Mycobacteroides chelonae]OHU47418.1 hypothetical protein BKG82_27825 [Mycobacteroides chelonae]